MLFFELEKAVLNLINFYKRLSFRLLILLLFKILYFHNTPILQLISAFYLYAIL